MGNYCYAEFIKNEATFINFDALNHDLYDNSNASQMMGDFPPSGNDNAVLKIDTNGELKIWDHHGKRYTKSVNVHGSFYIPELEILAKHVVEGQLVLKLDIEGCAEEYFIIEPNIVTRQSPDQMIDRAPK